MFIDSLDCPMRRDDKDLSVPYTPFLQGPSLSYSDRNSSGGTYQGDTFLSKRICSPAANSFRALETSLFTPTDNHFL